LKNFLRYWLPVLLWMAVIFTASTNAMSASQTSRFLRPFFTWLLPSASPQTIDSLIFGTRKSAHAAEYAVLALLLWRAWRKPAPGDSRKWNMREAFWIWLVAVVYAVSDEWHQSFYPSRQGSGLDVLIDGAGAAGGLCVAWLSARISVCKSRAHPLPDSQPAKPV
jgi:VanZ family protein